MIDKNKIAKAARKCLAAFRKANPDGYSSSIIDIEVTTQHPYRKLLVNKA